MPHKKTCEHCGVEFMATKKDRRYCSRPCASTARFGPKPVELCAQCGVLIQAKRGRKYCSLDCVNDSKWGRDNSAQMKSENLECYWCGKRFTRIPSKSRRGKRTFCGKVCMGAYRSTQIGEANPKWKGGKKKDYGPGWQAIRAKVMRLAGGVCVRCAPRVKLAVDVHHKVPLRLFRVDGKIDWTRANDLRNLEPLCKACHLKAHAEWRKLEEAIGLLLG